MNALDSSAMRSSGRASPTSMNCGRKATKKMDSLGLRMLTSTPPRMTRPAARRSSVRSTLLPGAPRPVQQVGYTGIFHCVECQGAGMQHGG